MTEQTVNEIILLWTENFQTVEHGYYYSKDLDNFKIQATPTRDSYIEPFDCRGAKVDETVPGWFENNVFEISASGATEGLSSEMRLSLFHQRILRVRFYISQSAVVQFFDREHDRFLGEIETAGGVVDYTVPDITTQKIGRVSIYHDIRFGGPAIDTVQGYGWHRDT
ncbi:hypothetical protein HU724_005545 [Pseudomonas iranensis]|uniref:hypothetical protein n=1 Tax=Pseudomonas iranensis TaxID=2745503 RepID=UPI0016472931|nr:hypothetical protein [Pseudomonas iranensis]QXI23738.1 hypothetical protein HU724_005545 [Pseudomonas iranensis]